MGEPERCRRRVTFRQLELLWQFLNKNRELATGYNKTTESRELSRRMWQGISKHLNPGDGAEKDWKGWCKYWNDYKSKLKKAAASRAYKLKNGGNIKPLTDIENKFLQILQQNNFGTDLLGVRVEPFEVDSDVELLPATPDSSVIPLTSDGQLCIVGLHSASTKPGPSWRVTIPPNPSTSPPTVPMSPPTRSVSPPAHSMSPIAHSMSPPPHSMSPPPHSMSPSSLCSRPEPNTVYVIPRRILRPRHTSMTPLPSNFGRQSACRPVITIDPQVPCQCRVASPMERRLSREQPQTADVTRGVLVMESRKRTSIEEEKLKMWKLLISEVREMKELFRQNIMCSTRNLGNHSQK